ncbi:MAG: hypothetical protein JEZ11_23545, partial [Desulfobacterales bacterium]|nr:hypothetical protein [Desulfobacterales bacterium]
TRYWASIGVIHYFCFFRRVAASSNKTIYLTAGDADTITNSGTLEAVAVSVAPSVDVTVSIEKAGVTLTNAKASSTAVGIDAGTGDDTVTNTGELTATAVATAESVAISVAKNMSIAGSTIWQGGTTAAAEAVGIRGDGKGTDLTANLDVAVFTETDVTEDDVYLTDTTVTVDTALAATAVSGADTIENDASITVTAVAVTPAVGVAVSLDGAGVALATAESDAVAVGIDAGAGDDTVSNNPEGTITATAVSTAVAVNVAVSKNAAYAGSFLFDGSVSSTAEAVGISGDGEGQDLLIANAVSVIDRQDVPEEGGDDGITDMLAESTDVLVKTGISVTAAAGNDTITNAGDVTATAVAVSPSVSVAVSIAGAAAAVTESTAESVAVGIDAGAGNDIVTNSGDVTATSVATAEAVNVAVSKGVALVSNTLWDGGISSSAEAVGIRGDGDGQDILFENTVDVQDTRNVMVETGEVLDKSTDVLVKTGLSVTAATGDDTITNTGEVTATAVAATPDVGVTVSLGGIAVAMATADAQAKAAGIDAGAGNDIVTNSGDVTATAVATAVAVNVAVSETIAGAGSVLYDGTSNALAEAVGISGDGDGQDFSVNLTVDVPAADGVLVTADLSTTAAGGNDTITNFDNVTATAVAVAPALDVAVAISGFAVTASEANAESRAVGIDGGTGDDAITNYIGGDIAATAVSTADVVSVTVTPSGFALGAGGVLDGGASSVSEAVGISGDGEGMDTTLSGLVSVNKSGVTVSGNAAFTAVSGSDTIHNHAGIVATAVSESPSVGVTVAVSGVAAAITKASAEADAAGIDAGAGDDAVDNSGPVTATAVAATQSVNVAVVGTGVAASLDGVLSSGTEARSSAVGISGDGGGSDTTLAGIVHVDDEGNTTISAKVTNLVAGGEDTITNYGAVTATSVASSISAGVSVAVTAGVALAATGAEATADATAIDGGSAGDQITNSGTLTSTAVANADALGVSVTIAGLSADLSGVLDGGASADATAVGISADGYGSDTSLSSSLSVKDGTVAIKNDATFTSVSGNDTVSNSGDVTATAVSVSPAVSVSVAVAGVAVASTGADATAFSGAIDLGAGDDVLTNSGALTATSVTNADALSVSVAPAGVAIVLDGGASARSEAVGISGDGSSQDISFSNNITVNGDGTTIRAEYEETATTGDDTITNNGAVIATSVATAASVDVPVVVYGVAGALASSEAIAAATAIDAGAGDDSVTNTGELVSTSVAAATAIPVSVSVGGVAVSLNGLFDGGTTAVADAVGISGDGSGSDYTFSDILTIDDSEVKNEASLSLTASTGNDTVTNSGNITATSVAESLSPSVAVAVFGVSAALAESNATATATAVETGGGDDLVTNSGELTSTAVANANSVGVSVTLIGVTAASNTLFGGGTVAVSEAVGITTDGAAGDITATNTVVVTDENTTIALSATTGASTGNDTVDNDGAVTATAVSVAPAASVGVGLIGVAGAAVDTKAVASAVAIDTGGGDDLVTNSGELTSTAVANANSVGISVTLIGVAATSNTLFGGGTVAVSEAAGITTDGAAGDITATNTVVVTDEKTTIARSDTTGASTGNDTVDNDGAVTATAVSVAPAASEGVGLLGVAGAAVDTEAVASAVAIDTGGGDDTITNNGALTSTAVANADGVGFSFNLVGVGALSSSLTALAETVGISGDGITPVGTITADSTLKNGMVTVSATRETIVASGLDLIENTGDIDATAVAVTASYSNSITITGVAGTVATATAQANAVAIDAGAGDDTVNNSGDLSATAVSVAAAVSMATNGLGVSVAADSVFSGGTNAEATAVGIQGDSAQYSESGTTAILASDSMVFVSDTWENTAAGGNDTITNSGSVDAVSVVVAPTYSTSVTLAGITAALAQSTAEANAIAIDAGAGDDRVNNLAGADLTATAVANADTISSSVALIGVAGSANAVWDGGTTATADAVGISGDGLSVNTLGSTGVISAGGGLYISLTETTETQGGDDTLINAADIDATAVVVVPTVSASVSVIGVSAALSAATSKAGATAISAGQGDDAVTNTGNLTAVAVSNADAISVAAGLVGVAGSGNSVWDGGTTATASAVGIHGDDQRGSTDSAYNVTIGNNDILITLESTTEYAGGVDTITNSGSINAEATAVTVTADVSLEGIGLAAAVSTATADADAAAIQAGFGADTVSNYGALTAVSDAVAVGVNVAVGGVGLTVASDAVWDGGTTATSTAVGIGGDGAAESETTETTIRASEFDVDSETTTISVAGGNDTLTNTGTIGVQADAESVSVGVSGVLIGASAALVDGTATADAAGISGDDGNDTVLNQGVITAIANADATTVAVSPALLGAAYATDATWDGGTTARSDAFGIRGGAGDDVFTNKAGITAQSTADTSATAVSVTLAGASFASSAGTADADAAALDAGEGNDTINNSAILVARSTATGSAAGVSVSVAGYAQGETGMDIDAEAAGISAGDGNDTVTNTSHMYSYANADVTAAEVGVVVAGATGVDNNFSLDGGVSAGADAFGITGGAGNDTLSNSAYLYQNATADASAGSVAVGLLGYSDADITATANAAATAMAGGVGDDAIANTGYLDANAAATADATSVAVTLAGYGAADANLTTDTVATGISGGNGADEIINSGTIDADARATATSTSVGVTLLGAGVVNSGLTTEVESTGISGGDGDDTIANTGAIHVTATSTTGNSSTNVTLAGSGQTQGYYETETLATGILGGEGDDTLQNAGSLIVNVSADSTPTGTGVTLLGVAGAGSGVQTLVSAGGLAGEAGNDSLVNSGNMDIDATATTTQTDTSVALVGVAGTRGGIVAEAEAAGLSGGDGDDTMVNLGDITVDATGTNTQTNTAVNLFGTSEADGTVSATSAARGIHGGDGDDDLQNEGDITANSIANLTGTSTSVSIAGVAGSADGFEAVSDAWGVNMGDGDDYVVSYGTVTVASDATVTQSGTSVGIFGVAGLENGSLAAKSMATGLAAGGGDDYLSDKGDITATADATLNLSSGATAIFGASSEGVTSGACARAAGLDAGAGDDYVEDAAHIDVDATATLTQSASGFTFGGATGTGSSILADAGAVGIDAGAGSDGVDSSAHIDVDADADATYDAGSTAIFGASDTDGDAGAISSAVGIDGGDDDGDDTLRSAGSIDTYATANVTQNGASFAFGGAGGSTGAFTGDADATGIFGGGGDDTLMNQGSIVSTADAAMSSQGTGTTIFGAATTGGTVGAEATAVGMDGGDGDDVIYNMGSLTAYAMVQVSQSGSAFTFGGASGGGGAFLADAEALGISGDDGADSIRNNKSMSVTATASMTVDSAATTIFGASGTDALSGAAAGAMGISGGDGDDYVDGSGSLTLSAQSDVRQTGGSFTLGGAGSNDGVLAASTSGVGIDVGAGDDTVYSNMVVSVAGASNIDVIGGVTTVFGAASAGAVSGVTSNMTGLDGGAGNDVVENLQTISVSGNADINQFADAYTFAGGSSGSAALSAAATVMGMAGGIGDDTILNPGVLYVTGGASLENVVDLDVTFGVSSSGSEGDLAVSATGISGGIGNDVIENSGTVRVTGDVDADFSSSVVTSAVGGAIISLDAAQNVTAVGIDGGAGNDIISNDREMNVSADASATADVYTWSTAGVAKSQVSLDATARAIGISGDSGNDTIGNAGAITVSANAEVDARSRAQGIFTVKYADADANAVATAYGILDLTGDNTIINDGTITVTADADVKSFEAYNISTYTGAGSATAGAIGIQTGSGNDTIINRGTITVTTSTTQSDGAVTNSVGSAINAGAGNDTVALCEGSSVIGSIYGGDGADTLVFDGSGTLNMLGIPTQFEAVVKQGDGTYSVFTLGNEVANLQITGGTLDISTYGMDAGDTFTTFVDGNGDFGQLSIGSGSVAGALVVNQGGNAFTGDMTFDIAVSAGSNPLGGTFATTTLPASTPLVSFSINQKMDRVQVAADVDEFSSLVYDSSSTEASVTRYLDTILPTATGDVSIVLGSIQAMGSVSEITAAYTELCPKSYRNFTSSTLSTIGLHVGAAQDRLSALRASSGPERSSGVPLFLQNGNSSYALPGGGSVLSGHGQETGGVWAVQLSDSKSQKGRDAGDPAVGLETTGLVIGMDYRPGVRTVLGASFSNTRACMSYEDNLKDGALSSYLGSTYAGHFFSDHVYAASVITLGQTKSESLRAILLGSSFRKAHSLHSGDILSAVVETGRVFEAGDWSTEVFGTMEYISLREEGFTEEGAGGVGLMVAPVRSDYLTSVTGLRLGRYFQSPGEKNLFMVQMNAGWLHDFNINSGGITVRFAGAPESYFTIDGNQSAPNGIRMGGAVTFLNGGHMDVSARLNADLYPDRSNVSGLIQMNLNF